MNNWGALIVVALGLTGGVVVAGTPDGTSTQAPAAHHLTLGNFFSEGWNSPWHLRDSQSGGAPDLPLFHSPTNFLFRGARTDYFYQANLEKTGIKDVQFLDEYIDYALNERFMILLFGNYRWVNHTAASDESGAAGGMIGRIQLVDTPTTSDCLNLRVDAPSPDVGIHTTKMSVAIAGWQDLTPFGAQKVGLYYSVENEVFAGKEDAGVTRDDCAYDVAIAKTWTPFEAPVADITSFVEFSGATSMQGVTKSRTELTVTPALQFILGKRNVIMMGVDFPLTHPSGTRDIYRVSYVYAF